MKSWLSTFCVIFTLFSCQESQNISDYTGNETTFALQQAGSYPVSGTITFKEKKDGSTMVSVELSGTDGDVQLPVHLHRGDISLPDAEIAALLNPVVGNTGKSETTIEFLADESKVTYTELMAMEASIKVHLSDRGPERDIILAGGNIGAIASNGFTNGRVGIGVCKSE